MPSVSHKALVLWIARKMEADGLRPIAFDGPADQAGILNGLPAPFAFGGLKPDIWATDAKGRLAAIGEAKTAGDVCNKHTVDQLTLFGRLRGSKSSKVCALYVAVPHSAVHQLDKALVLASLAGASVRRLHIPDALLQSSSHGGR